MKVAIAESVSTVPNAQENVAKHLKRFKEEGIKIDGDNLKLNSTIDDPDIKEIYDQLKSESSEPFHLTSFLKKDYFDIELFEANSKLEKIRKILISNYFSLNYNIENRQHSFKFFYNNLFKNILNNNSTVLTGLIDLIEEHQTGTNNNKAGFVALDDLYIDNTRYYAFLDFIQKIKDVATSFRIVDNSKPLNGNNPAESNMD